MRLIAAVLVSCLPAASQAQEESDLALPPSGAMFNTSISINAPLVATDRAGKQAEEDAYRRDLYARSARECSALLDTIAKSCAITAVNVSTQINSNPGQPDYLYATTNISMTVELK